MQNRPPQLHRPTNSHLFNNGGHSNRKGKARQLPGSVTDASRALVPPLPSRGPPPPPPPPPPLASTSHASGSGPGPGPHAHWPANQPAGYRGVPPRRPVPTLAGPDVRAHIAAAMKRLATITQQQQDRDVLQRAYDWPAVTQKERSALNNKVSEARQAEMRDLDKGIEAEYALLTTEMTRLLAGMVDNATHARVEELVKTCESQDARIKALEAAGRLPPADESSTASASGVAAAQQKRIDDLERKLNTLLQAQSTSTSPAPQQPGSSASASRPRGYSPPVPASSPAGTPFDHPSGPSSSTSSNPDLHAMVKELRDKYRLVGTEVRKQESQLGPIKAGMADQARRVEDTHEVVQDLLKRMEKVEQAQQPAAGPTLDPRSRPSSIPSSFSSTTDVQKHTAAQVAALRTDLDALTLRVSSQLGKRPHAGDDAAAAAADHPHKAQKRTEGSTPTTTAAAAAAADGDAALPEGGLLQARLRNVEIRLEGCEQSVKAARAGIEGVGTRSGEMADQVRRFEEKDQRDRERGGQQQLLAPPPQHPGPPSSSQSDMDLEKTDDEEDPPTTKGKGNDQNQNQDQDKLDVLERRIQQMEANGSPELWIAPVQKEVAEIRKLFDNVSSRVSTNRQWRGIDLGLLGTCLDKRVPALDAPDHPKSILSVVRELEATVARWSDLAAPVLDALRTWAGPAADGSSLSADQLRTKLVDMLVRTRDDLQRHGAALASHEQSLKNMVESDGDIETKLDALGDLGHFLSEALPQLRDLYLLVTRAQAMNLFPSHATLFPTDNGGGPHRSSSLVVGPTTAGAADVAAGPNGLMNGSSSSSGGAGANPPQQSKGNVAPAGPAVGGANGTLPQRPSGTPSPSMAMASLPPRPQQPQGQQPARLVSSSTTVYPGAQR
ncbi:hypothetical protein JCM3774_006465 [Rhodotorula dairenensis]